VSVLEMFAGEVTWGSGVAAAKALEEYLRDGAGEPELPPMPGELAGVLRKCFQPEPQARWKDLGQVVAQLQGIYSRSVGRGYSRDLPVIAGDKAPQSGIGERWTREGIGWTDPKHWLEKALRAEGRDPAEAAARIAKQAGSRRGQLVGELAGYDEARRIYERLVKGGREELEVALSALCTDAASVHATADDYRGAVGLYDRAIEILERLVNQEGRRELANDLATVYMNKAVALGALGDHRGAVGLYDRAIEIRERLVNQEGRRELASLLATICRNKAIAARPLE
jgi:tetratricopeptide (TPR) repeat protein